MSDRKIADYYDAAHTCRDCDVEIVEGESILVDPDGEYTDEGYARDLTVYRHVECPPEAA